MPSRLTGLAAGSVALAPLAALFALASAAATSLASTARNSVMPRNKALRWHSILYVTFSSDLKLLITITVMRLSVSEFPR